MIVVSGLMEIAPAHVERFSELSRVLIEATRREPGCVRYSFAQSLDADGIFEIFEEFTDEAALGEHVKADHYRTWSRALKEIEVVRVSIVKYTAADRTVLA